MLISLLICVLTLVVLLIVLVQVRNSRAELRDTCSAGHKSRDRLPDATSLNFRVAKHQLSVSLSRSTTLVLLVFGLLLTIFGQFKLLESPVSTFASVVWLLGLAIIVLLFWKVERNKSASEEPGTKSISIDTLFVSTFWRAKPERILLAILPLIGSFVVWKMVYGDSQVDRNWLAVFIWVSSIVSIIAFGWRLQTQGKKTGSRIAVNLSSVEIVLIVTLGCLAAILRFVKLESYPSVMGGDEGVMALMARDAQDGSVRNPFVTLIGGYPSLWFFPQALGLDLFGQSVSGARALSALVGVLAVLVVYGATRHLFDVQTAAIAGLLAACLNFQLFWSRNAHNNIATMMFFPLVLWLLDLGFVRRKPLAAVLAGVTVGLAQYAYVGNRLLAPLAVAFLVWSFAATARKQTGGWTKALSVWAPNAALALVAFLISLVPLVAHYASSSGAFNSRTNQVSAFSSGWLETEAQITGNSEVAIMFLQIKNAAMLPFNSVAHGFYRPDPPFVGWPLAIPLAIGVAIATIGCWRRPYIGIAAAWWLCVLGLAFTAGSPQTHRWVGAASLICMLGALGLVSIGRILAKSVKFNRGAIVFGSLFYASYIAISHVNSYFADPNPRNIYSDINTETAYVLARQSEALEPELTVYFAGAPRMWYSGFRNITYIAQDTTGIDLEAPLALSDKPLDVSGTTMFAFVPERIEEIAIVRQWFPGGKTEEHHSDDNHLLYVSYLVQGK